MSSTANMGKGKQDALLKHISSTFNAFIDEVRSLYRTCANIVDICNGSWYTMMSYEAHQLNFHSIHQWYTLLSL